MTNHSHSDRQALTPSLDFKERSASKAHCTAETTSGDGNGNKWNNGNVMAMMDMDGATATGNEEAITAK